MTQQRARWIVERIATGINQLAAKDSPTIQFSITNYANQLDVFKVNTNEAVEAFKIVLGQGASE